MIQLHICKQTYVIFIKLVHGTYFEFKKKYNMGDMQENVSFNMCFRYIFVNKHISCVSSIFMEHRLKTYF